MTRKEASDRMMDIFEGLSTKVLEEMKKEAASSRVPDTEFLETCIDMLIRLYGCVFK